MKYVIIIFQTKLRIYSSQGSSTSEGMTNLILLKKRCTVIANLLHWSDQEKCFDSTLFQ